MPAESLLGRVSAETLEDILRRHYPTIASLEASAVGSAYLKTANEGPRLARQTGL